MKNLLVLTAALAPMVAGAQLAQEDTPPPFGTIRQEFGGDGSQYVMTSLAGHSAWLNLPFGLDFSAGWSLVAGKRTRELGDTFQTVPAYGVEVYALKEFSGGIGSSKPFVRVSLRAIMDADEDAATRAQRLRATATLSIGWRVD